MKHATFPTRPAASRPIDTPSAAEALLIELEAPERLLRHGRLVLEAAQELTVALQSLGIALEGNLVHIGALLHDAGKIRHPGELSGGGARHEEAGQQLLLDQGIDRRIARFCVSHARWSEMHCSLEELLVALADTLWKGVRRDELERQVIDEAARRLGVDMWSLFVELDSCFERIADRGGERLRRSV